MCAPGRMDSPSILPMSQQLYLGLYDVLLGIGAIVPTPDLCVYPAHLGVITCWANTRVGLIVNVMHSAHIAREPRKLDRADGCKFGGGAQGGGGSTFSISSFARLCFQSLQR
jgi:hypothetical protein